ncbi:unnamed protein product [Symbiodinium sp. KB8]|nr:unnamed protein product [Symbiodinium sp. KB8]
MMNTAEEEAQTALAAIQTAKRTLREARHKQHMVKQNRKYYQTPSADVVDTAPPTARTSRLESLTNFVGYATEECLQTTNAAAAISTSEAVAQGMAVIDGGATQTIGSVKALEAVLAKNRQKYGTSGLKGVNVDEPPTFSFGNSTENRCLSTAQLHVQANGGAGELRVHTLECGESPILLSIQTLRSLKAQIVVKIAFAPAPLFMEKLTRPALVLSLKSYGEDPPPSWTKVELCARLQELADRGEVQPPRRAKDKTPLEDAVTALNKAAAKKSVLQAYVADMGIKVNGNETIAVLQTRAMQHLVATVEATGQDKMGFGKYASQSYNSVKMNDEQYCRWAMTTAEEGNCSMYLTRFATWLKNQATSTASASTPKVDMNQFVKDKEKRAANKIEKTTMEGYPVAKA